MTHLAGGFFWAWFMVGFSGGVVDCPVAADDPPSMELIEAKRIWDRAPHNAFTGLVRFKGSWFCVFREGQSHVSPDGALRVIRSVDGKQWESAALIRSRDSDLRDAKITVTPAGQLMLSGAEALHDPKSYRHQSLVWFSDDGVTWTRRTEVADRDFWLWRITWNGEMAYGFAYGCKPGNRGLRLYRSRDGHRFETLIPRVKGLGSYPNETSIVFAPDKTAYCLLRQDGNPSNGLLGESHPPYREWKWKGVGTRIGGPHMLRMPDGKLVAVVRLYDEKVRTSVCWIDPITGKLTESLKLPSGGDTSYAGMVLHKDRLWISYYSSHEEKTAIYLARVRIGAAGETRRK